MSVTAYAIFGDFAVTVPLPDVKPSLLGLALHDAASRMWEQDCLIGAVEDVPEPARVALAASFDARYTTWVALDEESRVVASYDGPGHPRHRGRRGPSPAQLRRWRHQFGRDTDGPAQDGTDWGRPERG